MFLLVKQTYFPTAHLILFIQVASQTNRLHPILRETSWESRYYGQGSDDNTVSILGSLERAHDNLLEDCIEY
jgi:hypothetical protein